MKHTLLIIGRSLELIAIIGAFIALLPPTSRSFLIYLIVFAIVWMAGGTLIKLSGKDVSEIKWPANKFLDAKVSELPKKKRILLWISTPIITFTIAAGAIILKMKIITHFSF